MTDTSGPKNPPSTDALIALYSTNYDSIKVFWEWRHRFITILLTVVSALGIASAAIERTSNGNSLYLSVPLFVGALFSFAVVPLDFRTAKIVKHGIARAETIEEQLAQSGDLGFFRDWGDTPFYGFSRVVPALGILLGCGLSALAIWTLIR